MKKTKLKLVLFFVVLLLGLNPNVYAQGGPDPPPNFEEEGPDPPPNFQDNGPEPPPAAPINQAIFFLGLIGVVYAYNKYEKK